MRYLPSLLFVESAFESSLGPVVAIRTAPTGAVSKIDITQTIKTVFA